MDGRMDPERWPPGEPAVAVKLSLAAVLGLAIVGCSDHRISLGEFLEMQQEACKAATTQPTTQPAARKALAEIIDKHLGPYKVGPSDVMVINLTGANQAQIVSPVQVRVDRNGMIELPLVGSIKVTGMELEDVDKAVRKAYVPKVYQQVVVHTTLVTPADTNVIVSGAVVAPGLVRLRRTERNLLFAINTAGGISQAASGKATLRRLRRPTEVVTLDLMDPVQLKAALTLDPLEPGDMIYVHPATPNMVFVGGLVNAPRPQTYPAGVNITILQALAASGGLRTDVTPREATLIRHMPDGRDVHVKLDLDRITSGKDPNITLAAGDILWIPHTIETRIQDWINRNIFIRGGVTVTYGVTGTEDMLHHDVGPEGVTGRSLQDLFDPFGDLARSSALQALQARPVPPP